jgi:hypothetical protein
MTESPKKSGRKRAIIAIGSLLGAGALVTAAVFVDTANINVGAQGGGIGSIDNSFILQVADVDADGNPVSPESESDWISANSPEGVSYHLPGAESLTPGESSTVGIPVRNASPKLAAALRVGIENRDALGDQTLVNALRFTIAFTDSDSGRTVLVSNAPLTDASATLEDLVIAGAAGEFEITVAVDPDAGNEVQGKTALIRAVILGESAEA